MARFRATGVAFAAALAALLAGAALADTDPGAVVVAGDSVPVSLTGAPGDAESGRAITGFRRVEQCGLSRDGDGRSNAEKKTEESG